MPARPPSSLARRLGLVALAVSALLMAAGCTAFSRAMKEGDQLTTERKWAQAESAYQRALAASPGDPEAKAKLRNMHKQWSAEVFQAAQAKHTEGDLAGATPLLVRALELDNENDAARELFTQTLNTRVEVALKALKEERLQEARAELDAVLAVDASHTAARKGVEAVQTAWARRWFTTAQRLEEEGKLGNALLAYVRADQERVGATPSRERAEAVRRKLRDEVAFLVVTGPADDKAEAPDVVQRLSPGRLSALLPQEVPIRVITADAPKDHEGVRLGLSVERVMPVRTVEQTQKSQRYVVTNKAVPNPKRTELETALLEQERTLEEVERKLSGVLRDYLRKQDELVQAREVAARCRERERKACATGLNECVRAFSQAKPGQVPEECNPARCNPLCEAEEGALTQRSSGVQELERRLMASQENAELQRREVQRGRDAFYREPLTVEEPVYADYPYDVELHRLSITASVTERLVDLAKDAAAASPHTEDYSAMHEDAANKAYDKVGVLADPVQLRSEAELRVEAGDKAMGSIAERVKERFDIYRQRKVEDARRGMVRPSAEDVVETAVRALLLTADEPPQDILLPLAKARGLTNPESIFGR
ncbi:outer membrane exchange accessory lipoprotein TraC [Vitiosangium sp. GDMCC 1.1324]|uniref:outer membrane exchange accessory lipoprotein TraC n=1 Tax=Vitiosangium sp. (strain GDMCC 1.1324) TaxID=2138576 RepID=UPI000D3370E7|nr:outer membrane exchange accessory lipoprotein TraC [Vitiosangium sp. GDMCC 1.1324]PTL81558.1 TetR family transcriptional regulator [Vitiosangium sp. GDMCC 1.1324]